MEQTLQRARNLIIKSYHPARINREELVEIYDFIFLHWQHLTTEYGGYLISTREELLSIPSSLGDKVWFFAQGAREPDYIASTNVRLSVHANGYGSITIDNDQHGPSLTFLSLCEDAFLMTSSVFNPLFSVPMPPGQVSAEPTSSKAIPLGPIPENIRPTPLNDAHGGRFWKPVWQHVMAHLIWWVLGTIGLVVAGYLGIANLIPKH
jgi:hypothetical protein